MIREFITFLIIIGLANMFPVIIYHLPPLNYFHQFPLDFNKNLGKNRLFGSGKTFGGLFAALLGGAFGEIILYLTPLALSNSNLLIPGLSGLILGLGAILGDLLKSFIKRRFNFKSGASLPIFDQIDFIIGGYLSLYLIQKTPNPLLLILSLLIIPPLHLLTNIIAYHLKLKKVWW